MAAVCLRPGLAAVWRVGAASPWKPVVVSAACSELAPLILAQRTRLIHTSSTVQRKNVAASGPEKYTEAFIKKQIEEFNIGKRHLANMMGEDPETFTQENIDKAIAYLFPSGLFEKRARPLMKHPDEIFPKQLAIQWGEDKRPFHFLFYTGKQAFYSLLHEAHAKFLSIRAYGEEVRRKGLSAENEKTVVDLSGRRWVIKEELENLLVEKLSDQDYLYFLQTMERLVSLPHSSIEQDYIHRYCKNLEIQSKKQMVNPLQYDENGVAFSTGEGKRKTAEATAIVRDQGKGKITINGKEYLDFFTVLQDREQLMFPFQFLDRLMKYDTECTVNESGRSAQAGAVRLAISRALLSFVSDREIEAMRQAGLLTADPRKRERKKPGQEGARRKFTWKKR
ncbi:28S ribosomal protein S9, mitochondrial [Hyla sarda]|uniref:28S ribosomal protein S9, mitochondrial n=1 Tax=Hyla sarda TaxID=327740 RepID=UPI0024C28706|nr:28S ribosomal protein S9, mitochondrial [Hyla sarda]